MRQQLIQYVYLLFAGASESGDIKQEILQNTLDRYDDLIAQGKSPEAAYRLAISGIGDINEILAGKEAPHKEATVPEAAATGEASKAAPEKKTSARIFRALAIVLFVLCPAPLLILQDPIGLCLLLAMVAVGVGLLVFFARDEEPEKKPKEFRSPFHRILHGITWGIGLAVFFVFSFFTGAWYISWLILAITGILCSLISACFDLNKRFLNALIRIVVFAFLTLLLTGCLLAGYLGVNAVSYISEEFSQYDGTLSSEGSVAAGQISSIDVQWVSGSITVRTGNTDTISFSETGNLPENAKMVWRQAGDSLVIQFSRPGINVIANPFSASKDLEIIVPEDWVFDRLSIESVSADITVRDLEGSQMDIINVSGKCRFSNCKTQEFSAETVSGNVEYEGSVNELDFNSVSAECTAVLSNVPQEIDLESVSGDLRLTLPADCGFTVELDTASGSFSSDYLTNMVNGLYRCGDGRCQISADTVSGDVKIHAPQ